MVKNKKGLSIVVTTLIIILLVLVAIGIVWLVVRNVVEQGTGQIDVSTRCLEIDVRATAVSCVGDPAVCNVTLTRKSGGDDIGGVKLVFKDATGTTSSVLDVSGDIVALATKVEESVASGLTTPNEIEVTVYLTLEGEEKLCSQTNSFTF